MANVQILALGRALVAGARGERGGAPSKDSLYGVAQIDNTLFKFSGRTGGTMRFRTEPLAGKDAALALFQSKLVKAPKARGGEPVVYTDSLAQADELVGGTVGLASAFFKARSASRLDKRAAMTKTAKAAVGDLRKVKLSKAK